MHVQKSTLFFSTFPQVIINIFSAQIKQQTFSLSAGPREDNGVGIVYVTAISHSRSFKIINSNTK